MVKKYFLICSLISLLLMLVSCTKPPKGIEPVSGFDINRYLGRWYEIARMDHSFERGLTRVTADYTLRDDGGIDVVNRGFDMSNNQWKEAKGKAYFVSTPDIGQLKVSFFEPFYGGYTIIELDKINYQYALVSGPSRSYLWILARSQQLDSKIIERLVDRAKQLNFATEDLIYLNQ